MLGCCLVITNAVLYFLESKCPNVLEQINDDDPLFPTLPHDTFVAQSPSLLNSIAKTDPTMKQWQNNITAPRRKVSSLRSGLIKLSTSLKKKK